MMGSHCERDVYTPRYCKLMRERNEKREQIEEIERQERREKEKRREGRQMHLSACTCFLHQSRKEIAVIIHIR